MRIKPEVINRIRAFYLRCFVTSIFVAKLYIVTFSAVSSPALCFAIFQRKGTLLRRTTPQCFPGLLGFGSIAVCSYF